MHVRHPVLVFSKQLFASKNNHSFVERDLQLKSHPMHLRHPILVFSKQLLPERTTTLLWKETCNSKHPMHLRHPVLGITGLREANRSLSAKEPLIIGLFSDKWLAKIRHPLHFQVRHSVPTTGFQ